VAERYLSKIDRPSPFMHVDCLSGAATVKNCHPMRALPYPNPETLQAPPRPAQRGIPSAIPKS